MDLSKGQEKKTEVEPSFAFPSNVKKALVLHDGSLTYREDRILRILEFFGIPFEIKSISGMENTNTIGKGNPAECAVLASLPVFDKLVERHEKETFYIESAGAVYLYGTEDFSFSEKSLRSILGASHVTLGHHEGDAVSLKVSGAFPEITGPMTGLEFSGGLGKNDLVFRDVSGASTCLPIISADGHAVFFLTYERGIPCFISPSWDVPDLDMPVTQGYYDVKAHFCSAAPLVIFLKYAFRRVMWQPVEHGACLIIDDPLLKSRYGFCDFRKLLEQMKMYEFTADIAFIPWNWRRTSQKGAAFFRRESKRFSVSIHGCDHTAAEFGTEDSDTLACKARLAQRRMAAHQERCGIRHEPIMVFPQGVFSESCPVVLKRTGYVAAVNTEVAPVGDSSYATRLRDVWDVAITRYGSFAVFTRRYAHHGIENFAFDLLLGKPCILVAHHGFFQDKGGALIELVEKLASLHKNMKWQSLGEVLRHACRYRHRDNGEREYCMYGSQLWVENKGEDTARFTIRKRENSPSFIKAIHAGGGENLKWTYDEGNIAFEADIAGGERRLVQILYDEPPQSAKQERNWSYALRVAARRILSELRDEGMYYRDRVKRLTRIFAKNPGE